MENITLRFAPETIGSSLVYSLLGMIVVMSMLVLLIGATKLQSIFLTWLGNRGKAAEGVIGVTSPAPVPVAPAAPVVASGTPEVSLGSVDDKTAAMIMAIVADDSEIPLEELRFISIKPL